MFNRTALTNPGPTLSLLWLFAILNTLFRDIHELVVASTIEEILSGSLNGAPVTDAALVAGAVAIQILLLSVVFSTVLQPRWARRWNLLAAPLMLAGTFFAPPDDPDDYLFAFVVLGAFATIFLIAWRWDVPRAPGRMSA